MAADAGASTNVTDPSLELVPLGIGAAYARPGEAQSCHLVRAGGRALVVDMGAGALNRLMGVMAPEDLEAVVITHMHPDHCVDLMALRVYMAWGPGVGRTLRVAGPPGLRARLQDFSGSVGWDALHFEDLRAGEGEIDLGGGLVVRHREVPHLPPTHAVRVDHGGASICLGADCGPNDALPELARDCDLLVCECTFGAEEVPDGLAHLNGRGAGEMAARAGAGRLVLVHGQPEYDRDAAVAQAAEAFGGPVAWAREGEAVAA
ncbi:MBL fold metallo-hydrolase [Miltoncostaea oceani]|uniref:MBL fold metallo-hydrolase n=1 Tax=Miltoncostaea oceani TaxID=2843216 RepID=UPI001C3E1CA0|nr:MBL fold metallo-hydrolase [Miltoncostaea oceani]